MITKEFLESCTDEQINKCVAWLEVNSLFGLDGICKIQQVVCNKLLSMPINYCSNPNDTMPIGFANRIGVSPRGVDDKWKAHSWKHEVVNPNPLRAICEVYILMSVGK